MPDPWNYKDPFFFTPTASVMRRLQTEEEQRQRRWYNRFWRGLKCLFSRRAA